MKERKRAKEERDYDIIGRQKVLYKNENTTVDKSNKREEISKHVLRDTIVYKYKQNNSKKTSIKTFVSQMHEHLRNFVINYFKNRIKNFHPTFSTYFFTKNLVPRL